MKVERYVEPAEFDRWRKVAEDMGFLYVASGPLVRSSYKVSPSYLQLAFVLIWYRLVNILLRTSLEGESTTNRQNAWWHLTVYIQMPHQRKLDPIDFCTSARLINHVFFLQFGRYISDPVKYWAM